MQNDPPENVYSVEFPPTKAQANNKGEVLWYAKGFGWYKGWFHMAHMKNTSHWTYLPDDLGIEPDSAEVQDEAFDAWVKQYPEGCFDSSTVAILKLGYVGGWRRGQP
jgi:hypothetical protein